MAKTLSASVTGCSNIFDITVTDSHESNTASAVIQCESTTLTLNDTVTAVFGYVGNTATLFYGYVKQIDVAIPENTYVVTCQDVLVRAMDYFIASDDPEAPLSYQNIQAETLVGNVLTQAGLTNYSGSTTLFEFGITRPIEVNLTSAFEFCEWIADLLAWHIYADTTGKVWFVDRKPYPTASDSISYTITEGETLSITKKIDERNLRNKVVVYGRTGISATASASSPYLPAGFYKTVVVATEWIDTVTLAQDAADYNLAKLNRLTTTLTMSIEGNPGITARSIVGVSNSYITTTGKWYAFAVEHRWSKEGYTTNLQLRQ